MKTGWKCFFAGEFDTLTNKLKEKRVRKFRSKDRYIWLLKVKMLTKKSQSFIFISFKSLMGKLGNIRIGLHCSWYDHIVIGCSYRKSQANKGILFYFCYQSCQFVMPEFFSGPFI